MAVCWASLSVISVIPILKADIHLYSLLNTLLIPVRNSLSRRVPATGSSNYKLTLQSFT